MRVADYEEGNYFELLSLDRGPGMADVSKCMADGYSTAGSPGTGLGAIARMADQFDMYSQLKDGTVAVARIVAGRTAPAIGVVHQPKQGQSMCGDAWLVKECDGQTLPTVSSQSAATLLPGQDKSGPSSPMSGASGVVVSCGFRLSEVGFSKFPKPQGVFIEILCSDPLGIFTILFGGDVNGAPGSTKK